MRHYWITLGEDWITTGLDSGGTGLLPDYMSSGPTGATYLPDLYRLPYPVEVLAPTTLRNVRQAVEGLVADAAYKNWLARQKATVKEAGAAVKELVQSDDFWDSWSHV